MKKIQLKSILPKLLRFWRICLGKTGPQRLFRYYIIIVLIGAILLITPIAVKTYTLQPIVTYKNFHYANWNFFYALVLAVSCFTDTGLTMTHPLDQFTLFGQIVILFLIQIGGIGFTAIKVILLFIVGKRFGLQEKLELDFERGNQKIGSSVKLIKFVLLFIFIIEFVFAFIFTFYFFFAPSIDHNQGLNNTSDLGHRLHNNFFLSLWYGIDTSISILNNAGFMLFGAAGYVSFAKDYFMQFATIILTIFGGIGFPIYYEIYRRILHKMKNPREPAPPFSLFSKIALISYFSVLAVIIFSLAMSELVTDNSKIIVDSQNGSGRAVPHIFNNSKYSGWDKFMIILFTSVVSRSTGVTLIGLQQFTASSKLILAASMFVGASPTSASGGIRSTTLFVCLIYLYYFFLNIKKPHIFHKKITSEMIKRSYMVLFISASLIMLSSLIIYTSTFNIETNGYHYNLIDSIFEAASAFGTTGYTTGLTNILNIPSLITIMLLMFMGQLTVSGTLLGFARKTNYKNYVQYPDGYLAIG